MIKGVPFWVMTRRGNSLILLEHNSQRAKLSTVHAVTREVSVTKGGKRVDLGRFLGVDLSPEALLEGVEIQEGDRLILFPTCSGVAE